MYACMHACMCTYVRTYVHTYIHTYAVTVSQVVPAAMSIWVYWPRKTPLGEWSIKILFYFYIQGISAAYENEALCAGIDHLHWPAVDSLPVFLSCTLRFPRTGPLYLHSPLSLLSTTRVPQKNVGEIESILQSYHNSSDFNRRS